MGLGRGAGLSPRRWPRHALFLSHRLSPFLLHRDSALGTFTRMRSQVGTSFAAGALLATLLASEMGVAEASALASTGLAIGASVLKQGLVMLFYAIVLANALLALLCVAVGAVIISSSTTPQARADWAQAGKDFVMYYRTLWYFAVQGGTLKDCPYFQPTREAVDDALRSPASLRQARVQLFSLALISKMWDRPHYRHESYAVDCRLNLRNVAVPGTGIPLSWFTYHPLLVWLALLVFNPMCCFAFALFIARNKGDMSAAARVFRECLLVPQDWFSFWQLNCRLATWHSFVTKDDGYLMEDKQTFLDAATAADIPVTPSLDVKAIVVKHRNEEGGLGFQSFKNAIHGGDWIIQERLFNSPALASFLPKNAPLSTLRVITASSLGLRPEFRKPGETKVQALSCAFRAGREGALTDHSSVLFDVNVTTGEVRRGTTSAHWCQLGLDKVLTTPWTSEHDQTHHPDSGKAVAGFTIPNMKEITRLVCNGHEKLMPHVPVVGWDVALTEKHGIVTLEVNLSCNFFRARFDKPAYFDLVERYFLDLEAQQTASMASDKRTD
jgi:hypothetical protein